MTDGRDAARRLATAMAAAAAGVLVAGGTARAADPDPSPQETAAEIRALRARIDQLERRQATAATQVDRSAVDRAIADAVRDGERRSHLFDMEGFTAGFTADRGFVLRTGDGSFLLHPWLQLSFRNVTNYREDAKRGASEADLQNGFEVRRAKVGFDGNLFGPDALKYTLIWGTDRRTQTLGLEEAWFVYKVGDLGVLPQPVSVQAGQFKNYFAHESMASSKRIFAAERSLLNDAFTGGDNFVQGAGLIYNEGTKGGPLQAGVAFNDGSNDFQNAPSAVSRNFQDFPANKWNFGAAARVQYKLVGEWKDYEDFTAATSGGRSLLVVGGGVDYSEAGDFDQLLHTVDVQYKAGPLAVYGAFLGRSLRNGGVGGAGGGTPSPAAAGFGNFYDYGFVGKVGYLVDPKLEVFGQYSYIRFDAGEFGPTVERSVHEIVGGVNYYFVGHAAKLTLDGVWLPNGTPIASDGDGVLAEPDGGNELLFRVQFQLLI